MRTNLFLEQSRFFVVKDIASSNSGYHDDRIKNDVQIIMNNFNTTRPHRGMQETDWNYGLTSILV